MEVVKSKNDIVDGTVSGISKITEVFEKNPRGTIATIAVATAAIGVATIKTMGKAIDALSRK
jgi:hypothetical protein